MRELLKKGTEMRDEAFDVAVESDNGLENDAHELARIFYELHKRVSDSGYGQSSYEYLYDFELDHKNPPTPPWWFAMKV